MVYDEDNFYVRQVLGGNTKAFSILVDRYKDFVYHMSLTIVRNSSEAEEVAQDTFLKAFNGLQSFSQESKFSSWIYKICYYTAISKTRNKHQKIFISASQEDLTNKSSDVSFDSLTNISRIEQKKYVNLAMKKLPENYQLVLTMFYLKELSLDEIAEITELTISNIKSLLHRGRKKLFSALSELLKNEIRSII